MSDSTFRRLTASRTGNVQILGAPAALVETPNKMVEYRNQGYNNAEVVNLGLGGRFSIAAAPGPTTTTFAALPAPNTSLPYETQRVTIPSSVSLYLVMSVAKIAAIDLIDGEPICADIFSEVSLNNEVQWPTAQTGQQIQITIGNTDTAAAHEPRVSLTGIRLRP